MKFNDLDLKMRIYETSRDYCVPPEIYIVARLDGRSFTKLTKEKIQFEAPFDLRFRDIMVATVKHLMQCGFEILYGYTESDEISLLFHSQEESFKRKTRKIQSILAGEASAVFSMKLGTIGVFDCRLSELPSKSLVVDYFRWRNEDSFRNALNAHCYWMLRKKGENAGNATDFLLFKSVAEKNELLFQNGINFNDLPSWQKRGIGVYWKEILKHAKNLKTGEDAVAKRRDLFVDYELPMGEAYGQFIEKFL